MRRILPLAFLLSLSACDSTGEEEPEERTYEVCYEVTGTFPSCTVT
jgi:hypothetical protein